MAYPYLALNNNTIDPGSLSLKTIKMITTTDLLNCFMTCSKTLTCDLVSKTGTDCQLINIFNDTNLIQDSKINLYIKKNDSKFDISDNKISKIFYRQFDFISY